jgi:hypothetical protein
MRKLYYLLGITLLIATSAGCHDDEGIVLTIA